MDRPKTPILLRFAKAAQDEPPVSSQDFLRSYYEYGARLRIVPAFDLYNKLRTQPLTRFERFSVTAALYQTIGMMHEDFTVTLFAWAAWAKNRPCRLADIYKQTFLTTAEQPSPPGQPYHEQCIAAQAASSKAVRVNPHQFLTSLGALSGEALLNALGIPWTDYPPVELVPNERRKEWKLLPSIFKDVVEAASGESGALLTISYNKLKHGPQMVVMNPHAVAIDRRGFTAEQMKDYPTADEPFIRLLFDGSRTQEESGEMDAGQRVAPFLIHHPAALEEVTINVIANAHSMGVLAQWLYRCVFGNWLPDLTEPVLIEIGRICEMRMNATNPRS